MSIFLDLIKAIIDYELSKWQETSVGKDQSYANKGLNIFGMGRNTQLSDEKRGLVKKLVETINDFKPLASDEANLAEIRKLLVNAQTASTTKSAKKNYVQGTLEPLLENLQSYINGIFNKLQAVNLLDMQYVKNDPYSNFCQYSARYFAQKVHEQKFGSKLFNNPNLSNSPLLTQEKDTLLQTSLIKCATEIDSWDEDSPYYQQVQKKCVLEHIEHVINENVKLCAKYGVIAKVPLPGGFNVKALLMTPEAGYIEYLMDGAKKEVEAIVVPMVPLNMDLVQKVHSSEHWMGLIKAVLSKKLDSWYKESIRADESYLNTTATAMSVGRDKELSKYKQELAKTLIKYLKGPETCNNISELEKILTDYDRLAAQQSADKNYQEATFSDTITQCIALAKAIHDKLESINLLNITSESDEPFEVFRYCAAQYFVRKVYNAKNNQSILDNPQLSNKNKLANKKEILLLKSIDDTALGIAILDKNKPNYMVAKQDCVLKNAGILLEKNKQLCEKYSYTNPIKSVGFGPVSMDTARLGPKKGDLDSYVNKTIECIKDKKMQQLHSQQTTITSTSSAKVISNYSKKTNNTNSANNMNKSSNSSASNLSLSRNNSNSLSTDKAQAPVKKSPLTNVSNKNTSQSLSVPNNKPKSKAPVVSSSESVSGGSSVPITKLKPKAPIVSSSESISESSSLPIRKPKSKVPVASSSESISEDLSVASNSSYSAPKENRSSLLSKKENEYYREEKEDGSESNSDLTRENVNLFLSNNEIQFHREKEEEYDSEADSDKFKSGASLSLFKKEKKKVPDKKEDDSEPNPDDWLSGEDSNDSIDRELSLF